MRFLENKIPNSTVPKIVPVREYDMPDQETEIDKKILRMLNEFIAEGYEVIAEYNRFVEEVYVRLGATIQAVDDLKLQIKEKTDYGVLSGLTVTAQEVPDMSVNVATGTVYDQYGYRHFVEGDTMTVIDADTENPRKDIIYLNAAYTISYFPGTPAAEPTAPDLPLNGTLIAEIAVAANAIKIETANITDKRKLIATNLGDAINELYMQGFVADQLATEAARMAKVNSRGLDAVKGEAIPVALTNSSTYPFNNSVKVISLTQEKTTTDYYVDIELVSAAGGGVGDFRVTDKLLNGFKLAFTGAATAVNVICRVKGGV